jgi:hypothetical protein
MRIGVNGSAAPPALEMAGGVRHRLRFINISVQHDAEIALLRSDSSVVEWRALAKDGADLHREHATARAATLVIAPGESYDYEVMLPRGDYRLRVKSQNDVDVVLRVR